MHLLGGRSNRAHLFHCVIILWLSRIVTCLYQDQVGKFDWRKQFIGIPKFVYRHDSSDSFIVATESNVLASILTRDGSVVWRKLLPNSCNLNHLSILKSSEDSRDYLIRTACNTGAGPQTHIWNPQNGLLASDMRYKELVDDDQAESQLGDMGHTIGDNRVFKLSDDLNLTVSKDGKVTLKSHHEDLWSREEALASITAVEIARLPADVRDKFGLKKRIVIVTDCGKMFGLDTLTGDVVWEQFNEDLSTLGDTNKVFLALTKQSEDDADQSRAIVVHPAGTIIEFNPITGLLLNKNKLAVQVKQLTMTEENESLDARAIIILDKHDRVHVYPEDQRIRVIEDAQKYYMTVFNKIENQLEGYRLIGAKTDITSQLTWTFAFNATEQVLNFGIKRMDEEVHSPARVLGDRGILYKYVNPNLMAVMTQGTIGDLCNSDYYLNVYMIDGVTGSLVYSIHHPKTKGPSKMVHSENWLVYSYYNTKSRRTEVSSLEMFEGTTQTDSDTFSSLNRASIQPKLVEHKSFIFPGGIDAMVDTTTLRGMTNRHVIVALSSGSLLEIPKIFLDPRRPINMLMEHREEGLIPYMPELPIPSDSIINYDQTLLGVRRIITSPAMLESTSLVFAHGLDLFFTRVTPSKTFDILKDDFDHLLITAVLVFLVLASYVSKLLAQRKALRAAWK